MPSKKTATKKSFSSSSPSKAETKAQIELAKEMRELSKEIRKTKNLEFLRVFKQPWKFLWFSFLKGLMIGFGSVLGASVLVAAFVYILSQISFVPIVGDFVEDILQQIQVEKVQE